MLGNDQNCPYYSKWISHLSRSDQINNASWLKVSQLTNKQINAVFLGSLCFRMLGQKSGNEESGAVQHGMTPPAFLFHYRQLQPFLLGELTRAAKGLRGPSAEAKLHLQPSLFPILTLLAQLQPAVTDTSGLVFRSLSALFTEVGLSSLVSIHQHAVKMFKKGLPN